MAGIPLAAPHSGTDERGFTEDLRTVIAAVRRGWRFVAVAVLICLAVAIVYLAKRKVVYQGTSRLLILQQGRAPLATTATDSGRLADANEDYVPTHAIILKSPMIVGRAVESLGTPGLTTRRGDRALDRHPSRSDRESLQLVYQSEDPREAVRLVEARDPKLSNVPRREISEKQQGHRRTTSQSPRRTGQRSRRTGEEVSGDQTRGLDPRP